MEHGRDAERNIAADESELAAILRRWEGYLPAWEIQPGHNGGRRGAAPWAWQMILSALLLSVVAVAICADGPLGARVRGVNVLAPVASPTATNTAIAQHLRDLPNEVLVTSSPLDDTVNYYLSHMSLDEKLGQMIMVETYSTSYSGDIANMVGTQHAGALIVYKKNMLNPDQLRSMIAGVQSHSNLPLLITMDEEGGNVDRLGDMGFASRLPSAHSLGASGNPQNAYNAGSRAANSLKSYGINVDLAPVVDVRTISNPVIGPRIFGTSANSVDQYAGSFLDGLQQNGVIGTLKHWPGIGSASLDPHKTLPTITRSRSQLDNTDFAAFNGLLDKQPGMIMVTHVLVNAIDPNMPASLSPKMVDGVLRGQLGYQGVVITDNLWMKGVSLRYSLGEAGVLAVLAGDDLLEGPWSPGTLRSMLNAMRDAVNSGRISQDRIDLSVRRILTLKAKYGILPLLPASVTNPTSASGNSAPLAPTGANAASARWAERDDRRFVA
jgi:beta-N-acetylhexosaminidase